jgi:hypothetical protein
MKLALEHRRDKIVLCKRADVKPFLMRLRSARSSSHTSMKRVRSIRPSKGKTVWASGKRLYLRRRRLKYLGLILQRYGLVEGTPDNEASSLLLR